MDLKLYKKTYPYICSSCGEFSHSKREYCEICGKKDAIVEATKQDYKDAKEKAENA